MSPVEALAAAQDVILREALYLDARRWEDWLALYDDDAEFWVPAWRNEDEPVSDVESEISLVYLSSREQLAERVGRVTGGRSAASTPLPRTAHAVSNILASAAEGGSRIDATAVVATHIFDVRRREPYLYFGRAEFDLSRAGDVWKIKRKKIVLMNDYLTTIVDFYTI
jgi:3-phenylpropionate/cinnamic acid dioxygenase small subunit